MSNRLDTSQTEMSPKAMKCAEQLPLFLRVHTRLKNAAPRSARNPRHQWARYALIIDAETSINTQQSLTFGFYRFCDLPSDGRFICLEEGIFYTEDLDRRSVGLIRKYVQAKRAETTADCPVDLQLYSRSEFVKEVFLRACDAGAVIVGCNLPFDLSRLAVEYRVSRKRSTGWSLILFHYYNRRRRKWLPNTYLPRIRMNPKDSRDSFISLAGGNKERGFRRGRFLNLLTMAWALRNRRHSLEKRAASGVFQGSWTTSRLEKSR
jgi:hypothetical protein